MEKQCPWKYDALVEMLHSLTPKKFFFCLKTPKNPIPDRALAGRIIWWTTRHPIQIGSGPKKKVRSLSSVERLLVACRCEKHRVFSTATKKIMHRTPGEKQLFNFGVKHKTRETPIYFRAFKGGLPMSPPFTTIGVGTRTLFLLIFFWKKNGMGTWRIIPVGKWSITMVIVGPLSKVVPLPNGLN